MWVWPQLVFGGHPPPQIWGVDCQKTLVLLYFWTPIPLKFGGENATPPKFGGYGLSGHLGVLDFFFLATFPICPFAHNHNIPKNFASDATSKRYVMAHQMKNLCVSLCFIVWKGRLVRHPGVPQKWKDELKNGRGRAVAVGPSLS